MMTDDDRNSAFAAIHFSQPNVSLLRRVKCVKLSTLNTVHI